MSMPGCGSLEDLLLVCCLATICKAVFSSPEAYVVKI